MMLLIKEQQDVYSKTDCIRGTNNFAQQVGHPIERVAIAYVYLNAIIFHTQQETAGHLGLAGA